MKSLSEKAVELLEDLEFENPKPEERWFHLHGFDPLHGLGEIRYAKERGWIEFKEEEKKFRLTPKGRSRLERKK